MKDDSKKYSVTDLAGVYAGGTAAGIKARATGAPRKDLAYLFVPRASGCAGVFTRNAFAAPPLIYSKQVVAKNTVKAIIINSGNANAATGAQGLRDARETAVLAAKHLGVRAGEVAVTSTGIIGVPLPMPKIRAGLESLLENPLQRNGRAAASAIMTTDLVKKEVFMSQTIDGVRISVGGFAKGSGMIAPNMATMLGFLVTDAKIGNRDLQTLLRSAVDDSFNMTSVDTDTSTNDMVLAFATGEKKITLRNAKTRERFRALLTAACQHLAKLIAFDGEGATKLIEVSVAGAKTKSEARRIALNIVNSPLVKTAIHGADPNWGRVVAAAGKDPALTVDPARVDLNFGGAPVMRRGKILPFKRDKVSALLKTREVKIAIDLNVGRHSATAWGCDLTKGYIDINTAYS